MTDQKERTRHEFNNKLRDTKRQLERDYDQRCQKMTDKINGFIEEQKEKLKSEGQRVLDGNLKRLDEQIDKIKEQSKLESNNHQLD